MLLGSLRSSSDSGNLTFLWKCRGIYIGGWSMMTDIITSWKRGPSAFRCHFWLPKRAGPTILTEGGKFWYCLMISPADAKLTNAWIPNKHRHLCNDIMPYHAWQHSLKSTQGRVAPLTSLHQRSCTEGKWWKMWIHLDNSIRIQETHSTNLAMVLSFRNCLCNRKCCTFP